MEPGTGARGGGFDELFAHEPWVRRLAVRLCRDESEADDLVQDVWLEALRGGSPRSPRPWLGGIVRHLWRRRRAGRTESEEASPRDPMPSPDALLARAELQRRVLAEVAKLDETYRTVVLMRHFEGLSSEDIARRLGVPGSTVRNRLTRAHDRLRARLDRDYGGNRGAWTVLFAPALPGIPAGTVATGIGVAMKVKLVVVAAVVAAVTVGWWSREGDALSPGVNAPRADVAPARPRDPADIVNDTSEIASGARTGVEASRGSTVEHVLVWGDLLGTLPDRPVDGQILFVTDFEEAREASVGTGPSPSYSIFGLAPGKYRSGAWFRGYRPLEDEIELPSDSPTVRRDVTLVPTTTIPVRFVDAGSGEPLEIEPFGWSGGLGAIATSSAPPRELGGILTRVPARHGVGVYHDPILERGLRGRPEGAGGSIEILADFPVLVSAVFRTVVLETRAVRGDERELVFEIDRARIDALKGSLELTCVDSDTGAPLIAGVSADPLDSAGGGAGTSAADGWLRLDGLLPGMLELRVHAKGYAGHMQWICIEPGSVCKVGTIALSYAARVDGRVVGPDGRGVRAGLNVVARPRGSGLRNAARRSGESSTDGRFRLTDPPRRPVRVVAEPERFALCAVDVDTSSGDVHDLELRVEPGVEVELRCARSASARVDVLLVDAQGLPLIFLELPPMLGRTLRLAPGAFEALCVSDERVIARRAFVVAQHALSIELPIPE